MKSTPELSVIVPVFNEAETIGRLLDMLGRQQGIELEVVVVDGGSSDGTTAACSTSALPVRLISSGRGRGRQMNAGAASGTGKYLLFLHADSDLPDPFALRRALDLLRAEEQGSERPAAGRFRLRFDGVHPAHPGFRFHEMKARLGRPGCIHGDQGFLIHGGFFRDLGCFDEQLPLLEDTLLAERIREKGRWLLLPAYIRTSPRRFLIEGIARRDTLNAVIVNSGITGWTAPLREIPSLYRAQCATGRLDPLPFFLMFRKMLEELPEQERREVWDRTASFVRDNAWQIPLALDALLQRQDEATPALVYFERRIGPALSGRVGRVAAKLLVKGWFFGSILVWKLLDRLRLRGR